MKYQEYEQKISRAVQFFESGDYPKASAAFKELLSSDISDIDKAVMCFNLAVAHDKMGQTEETVSWYEKGTDYEKLHGRYFVAEKLAAYLAEKGRYPESLARYEALLHNPALTEPEKHRIEQNIAKLRKRAG